MYRLLTVVAAIAVAAPLGAQQYQRRATMVGGGSSDRGKCTIEVVVDGAAEIEVRGDQGVIRNLSGRPAEWRRFECSSAMPTNPADFRFAGIDGRGRQSLLREPRNGGVAVVRIEDSNGGSEGYTFDLMWGGTNYPGQGQGQGRGPEVVIQGRGPGGYNPGNNDYRGGERDRLRSFTAEQAVNVCQDSVRRQAQNRFRGRRVEFLSTRIDDNPGRNDWVVGAIDVLRGNTAVEGRYRFSCSVNFETGQVRSVQIDQARVARDWRDDRGNSGTLRAVQTCQAAVESRVRRDGYDRVAFQSVRMDDAPGRNDWVVGNVRADRGRGTDAFSFSCSVDLRDGDVRSVQVDRR